ncbi:Redoxin-domain-containing protein [Xylariales sp. AK1849]|nr:Redoxin-domain-containing protein [Xylariales sp. AK1849]
MAFRALRPLASSLARPRARTPQPITRIAGSAAQFHTTRPLFVSPGDPLPNLNVLVEDSPGNKVNLGEEFTNTRGLVIGVPAAFSGACSQKHIPSYIKHPKVDEILSLGGKVVVVSVNDAFVMKAWQDQLDPVKESGIRFLGDPSGEFTQALDLDFDSTAIFGNRRSKRYALVIEDGKVESVHVEPDNTGTDASMADKVLG